MEALSQARWKVKWSVGPHAGTVTNQSSKSLTFWTALGAPASEDEEGAGSDRAPSDEEDVDEGTEVYAQKKARFEKFNATLVGKEVKVNPRCYNHPTPQPSLLLSSLRS